MYTLPSPQTEPSLLLCRESIRVLQGVVFCFFFSFWLYARLGKNLISDRDAPNRGQGEISSRVSLSGDALIISFFIWVMKIRVNA